MSSRRYTPEFRAEAVRQVTERGYPVREVAGRLGVSTHSLYKWLKETGKTPRLVADEDLRAENARLKAELKRVEEERDILNKYLARHPGEVRVRIGASPGVSPDDDVRDPADASERVTHGLSPRGRSGRWRTIGS